MATALNGLLSYLETLRNMTWEDIKRIHEIANEVWDEYVENSLAKIDITPMKEREYYEEILRRYNESNSL